MSIRHLAVALSGAACLVALVGCGQRQAGEPESEGAASAESTSDAGTEAPQGASALAGTEWRLVEFQSMDDAVGTTKPENPSAYTIAFGADGTVAMQLNCNRGTGPYAATPGEGGRSGTLKIGPLATTKALCPPPSMDEKIAADMDHVTGFYLDEEGRLALSLMADAGIYLWEPNTSL